ncbi:thioredoxin domain-containing protein [Streptomyces sp. CA-250714]|uniref:thioredoxin domain-containing protein n=1 Tax=Streptomyces sp. CA-250714 TaxID=3240060 RepID=UPI003D94758E
MIPANTTGKGGTTVVYGADPEAPEPGPPVLDLYLDMRCPYCARMENALGGTMQQLADDGEFVLHFHFGTFMDDKLGGQGSHHALAALGAAADVGQSQLLTYLRTLYRNQPHEGHDGFAEDRMLLGLANDVPGLRRRSFDEAVLERAHRSWVTHVSRAFDESGVAATPTVVFRGRPVAVLDGQGQAVSPEHFTAQIHDATE